jgi:hypothetical protein
MPDQFENKHIDKRVVHRYVRKGVVDEKEYDRLQKGLPDLADQAMPIEASIEIDDVDEGDAEA